MVRLTSSYRIVVDSSCMKSTCNNYAESLVVRIHLADSSKQKPALPMLGKRQLVELIKKSTLFGVI